MLPHTKLACLGALLALLFTVAACDTAQDDDDGSFRFEATSPVNAELTGRALFAPKTLEGRVSFELQFQTQGSDERINIYLNRPILNTFAIGSYQVIDGGWEAVKIPARDVMVFVSRRPAGSDVVEEWTGQSGAIRISRSDPGMLEGTVDMTVVDDGNQARTMKFTGSFKAVRGV